MGSLTSSYLPCANLHLSPQLQQPSSENVLQSSVLCLRGLVLEKQSYQSLSYELSHSVDSLSTQAALVLAIFLSIFQIINKESIQHSLYLLYHLFHYIITVITNSMYLESSPHSSSPTQYHLLVQQLQHLITHHDVKQTITHQMENRIDRVLSLYKQSQPLSQTTNTYKNTSKKFIKKQLLMLPKYHKSISRSHSVKDIKRSKVKRRKQPKLHTQMKDIPLFQQHSMKEIQFLKLMKDKQQSIIHEKQAIQSRIKQLKDGIQEQKLRLQTTNKDIITKSHKINQFSSNSNQLGEKKGTIDKRLGDMWSQVKILKQSYDSTLQQNEEVRLNLKQQKQLISMYRTVIEELKSQLKIQKSQRDEKKKQLRILRKTEEVSRSKLKRANWKTDQMMEKVKKSMEKWN